MKELRKRLAVNMGQYYSFEERYECYFVYDQAEGDQKECLPLMDKQGCIIDGIENADRSDCELIVYQADQVFRRVKLDLSEAYGFSPQEEFEKLNIQAAFNENYQPYERPLEIWVSDNGVCICSSMCVFPMNPSHRSDPQTSIRVCYAPGVKLVHGRAVAEIDHRSYWGRDQREIDQVQAFLIDSLREEYLQHEYDGGQELYDVLANNGDITYVYLKDSTIYFGNIMGVKKMSVTKKGELVSYYLECEEYQRKTFFVSWLNADSEQKRENLIAKAGLFDWLRRSEIIVC